VRYKEYIDAALVDAIANGDLKAPLTLPSPARGEDENERQRLALDQLKRLKTDVIISGGHIPEQLEKDTRRAGETPAADHQCKERADLRAAPEEADAFLPYV
jgi:hypothetical protein